MRRPTMKQLLADAQLGDVVARCQFPDRLLDSTARATRQQVVPWLRRAATAGDAWAQYEHGRVY
jgi:hypothetical protein